MLTKQNKIDIYNTIIGRFNTGEVYPLSAVGKFLSSRGFTSRRFGYTQMKNLMKDVPEFIDIEEYENDGHSNCNVTFRTWDEADSAPVLAEEKAEEKRPDIMTEPKKENKPEEEGISLTVFQKSNFESFTSSNRNYGNFSRNYGNYRQEDSGDSRNSSGGVRFTGVSSGSTFKEKTENTNAAANQVETASSRQKTENDREEGSSFERLAYLPPKVLDFLVRKGFEDPAGVLNEYYLQSLKKKTYQQRGNTITFPFGEGTEEEMVAVLKRNEKSYGKPWYLSYVGMAAKDTETVETEEKEENEENKITVPGKALEDFADIGYWQEFLKELAETALPENWDYRGNRENGRYYILKKYIQYTFYRLQQENKVCISEGNFAAFNTGLVNNRYQDIFACFVPNPKHDTNELLPEWKFESFAIAGQRGKDGSGKLLTSYFNPLPSLPKYYESISDLFYDLNAPLVTDYEHIIIDNIDRLPMDYLRECCFSDEEAQSLLDQVERAMTREKKKQAYYQLSSFIIENDRIYRRMKARMEDAIETTLKRVRWNFRTAVPCYFPKGNCMSLMLPLALADDNRTDAALIVLKNPSGSYQGQTILELEKAYLDARLLCRPNNDWMSLENIGRDRNPQQERGEERGTRTGAPRENYVPRENRYNNGYNGYNRDRNPERGETYRSDYGRVNGNSQPRYNSFSTQGGEAFNRGFRNFRDRANGSNQSSEMPGGQD